MLGFCSYRPIQKINKSAKTLVKSVLRLGMQLLDFRIELIQIQAI